MDAWRRAPRQIRKKTGQQSREILSESLTYPCPDAPVVELRMVLYREVVTRRSPGCDTRPWAMGVTPSA